MSRDKKEALAVITGIVVFIVFIFGGIAAFKEFNRYQKRQDAKNRTTIVRQEIKTAEQRARVIHAQNAAVRAKAEQRVIEAEGIRKAQDKIAATLTPLYVSHEAIQAQKQMASSGRNNTSIYIPSGNNGVPLVNDISKAGR